MKMYSRSALAAVATVLAHPFRTLFAPKKLTLTAPVLNLEDYEIDSTPARSGFVQITAAPALPQDQAL